MQAKYLTHALLVIIAVLMIFLIFQNRELSTIKVKTENEDAIVRIYVALSSEKHGKEYKLEDVEKILVKHFSGATVQESVGYYEGKREKSLNITIINCCDWKVSDKKFRKKVEKLNKELTGKLGQDAILIELVSNDGIEGFQTIE
jgi:PII-like signaling protein